jgi:hypothetical protein
MSGSGNEPPMTKALAVSSPDGTYVILGDTLVSYWDGPGNEQNAIRVAEAINDVLFDSARELRHGLEQSVRLQSHYAGLLNLHDGGERLQFATADEWLARLRSLGT